MLPQKQAEEAIVNQSSDHDDRDEEIPDHHQTGFSLSNFLWHGGSVYDAWFSCASNQVSNFTKNPTHSFCFSNAIFDSDNWVLIVFAGCSSSADIAILFLSTGYAFRHHIPSLLWHSGKLDCLSHQCSLRWVQKPKGERKRQLQEPCHSG